MIRGQEPRDKWFAGVEGGAEPSKRARHLQMALALNSDGDYSQAEDLRYSRGEALRSSQAEALRHRGGSRFRVLLDGHRIAFEHCILLSSQGAYRRCPTACMQSRYGKNGHCCKVCICMVTHADVHTYNIGGEHEFGKAKPCMDEAFCERDRSKMWHWQTTPFTDARWGLPAQGE